MKNRLDGLLSFNFEGCKACAAAKLTMIIYFRCMVGIDLLLAVLQSYEESKKYKHNFIVGVYIINE